MNIEDEVILMKIRVILLVLLCLLCGSALAADPPPLALMKNVSHQTLTALRQHKGQLHDRRVIRATF